MAMVMTIMLLMMTSDDNGGDGDDDGGDGDGGDDGGGSGDEQEQGWRSGESARRPPMCPEFDSRPRRRKFPFRKRSLPFFRHLKKFSTGRESLSH